MKKSHKKKKESTATMLRGMVLSPGFDRFGPCERASWHSSMLNRIISPVSMISADTMCQRGDPSLVRTLTSGDDRKPSILTPPSEMKGTEVWFIHKRHRVVFVVDTSPSMRTLRDNGKFAPLSAVGSAIIDFCLGLSLPMGSLRQEVFVSVVAHVHTKQKPDDNSNTFKRSSNKSSFNSIGRDSVVELVQGFLLTGNDTESALSCAADFAKEVEKELGKLEAALWTLIKPSKLNNTTKNINQSEHGNDSEEMFESTQLRGVRSKSKKNAQVMLCAPPSSLEPMIEAGVFGLKWLPLDGLPAIVLVTDGVCRDKQLLTTYDGMIMQLCRRDITLHVLQLGIEGTGGAAFGMVSDTDTIGRLCEMTGGSLYNPQLLKSLIRLPATILSASSVGSTNGGSSDDGSYGSFNSFSHTRESFSGSSGGSNSADSMYSTMISSWGSFSLPNLSRTNSTIKDDGFKPSAFHQAMLFRLSPLSGIEGDKVNPMLSFLGPEGDPSFKVILIRQAADRYHLPRIMLERLVDMRNSEGFRLVESSFTNSRPLKGTMRQPNTSTSRAFLTWTLRWQTDVLLKYTMYFTPYEKAIGGSSRYRLGGADVRIDVVCNSDFMLKLNLNNDQRDQSQTKHEWTDRRDVLFNDPAKQLKHFLKVLREVDQMLVQVCGLVGVASKSVPTLPHEVGLKTGGIASRCKILGQLGVSDWHRWFQVVYFEVRAQKVKANDEGLPEKTIGVSITHVQQNKKESEAEEFTSQPSALFADGKNFVVKSEAKAQLNKIMRAWAHRDSHGRVLSPHLFLRHLCAKPQSDHHHHHHHLSHISRSSSSSSVGSNGSVKHHNVEQKHEDVQGEGSECSHDHDFSGFCLVKLNWDVGFGGLASFHLGFFNVDISTRLIITEELQRTLGQGYHQPNMGKTCFEVTRRALASKLVDWSGLIKPDPMDASGRDDSTTAQSKTGSKIPAVNRKEIGRGKVVKHLPKLLPPPIPLVPSSQGKEETASGGSLMSLTSYLRHHHWKWDICNALARSCPGTSSLILGAICRLRQEEGFHLMSDSDKQEQVDTWDDCYLLAGEDAKNSTVLGSLFMVREIEVFQFPVIGGPLKRKDHSAPTKLETQPKYGSLLGPNSLFSPLEQVDTISETAATPDVSTYPSTSEHYSGPPPPPKLKRSTTSTSTAKVLSVLQFRAVILKTEAGNYSVACGLWMDPQYGSISEDEAKYLLRGLVFSQEENEQKHSLSSPESSPKWSSQKTNESDTSTNSTKGSSFSSAINDQYISTLNFFKNFVKSITSSDQFCLSSIHAFLYAYSSLMGMFVAPPLPPPPNPISTKKMKSTTSSEIATSSSSSQSKMGRKPRKSQKISIAAQYGLDCTEYSVPLLNMSTLKRYASKRLLAQRLFTLPVNILFEDSDDDDNEGNSEVPSVTFNATRSEPCLENSVRPDNKDKGNDSTTREVIQDGSEGPFNKVKEEKEETCDMKRREESEIKNVLNEIIETIKSNAKATKYQEKLTKLELDIRMRNQRLYYLMISQLKQNFAHAEIDLSFLNHQDETMGLVQHIVNHRHEISLDTKTQEKIDEVNIEDIGVSDDLEHVSIFLRLVCNGCFMMVEVPPFSEWMEAGGVVETSSVTLEMIRTGMFSELELFSRSLKYPHMEAGRSQVNINRSERLVIEAISKSHARAFCCTMFETLRINEDMVHPEDITWALKDRTPLMPNNKIEKSTINQNNRKQTTIDQLDLENNDVGLNSTLEVDYFTEVKTEVDVSKLAKLCFHRQKNGNWHELIPSRTCSMDKDNDVDKGEFWQDVEWHDALAAMFKPLFPLNPRSGNVHNDHGILPSQSLSQFFEEPSSACPPHEFESSKLSPHECLYVYHGPLTPSILSSQNTMTMDTTALPQGEGLSSDTTIAGRTNETINSPKGFVFVRNGHNLDKAVSPSESSPQKNLSYALEPNEPPLFIRFTCSISSQLRGEAMSEAETNDIFPAKTHNEYEEAVVDFDNHQPEANEIEDDANTDDEKTISDSHSMGELDTAEDVNDMEQNVRKETCLHRRFGIATALRTLIAETLNESAMSFGHDIASHLRKEEIEDILEYLQANLIVHTTVFNGDHYVTACNAEALDYRGKVVLTTFSSLLRQESFDKKIIKETSTNQDNELAQSNAQKATVEEFSFESNQDSSLNAAKAVVAQAAAAAAAFRKAWDNTTTQNISRSSSLLSAEVERGSSNPTGGNIVGIDSDLLPMMHRRVLAWFDTRMNQLQALHTLRCLLGRFSSASWKNADFRSSLYDKNEDIAIGSRGSIVPVPRSGRLTRAVVSQVQQELPFIPPQYLISFSVKLRFLITATVEDELTVARASPKSSTSSPSTSSSSFSSSSSSSSLHPSVLKKTAGSEYSTLPTCIAIRLDQELRSASFLDLRRVNDTYVLVQSDDHSQYLKHKVSRELCSEARLKKMDESDDVLGKCSVPFWALIKLQLESGKLIRASNDKIDPTMSLKEKGLEHSLSVQLHFPYSHKATNSSSMGAKQAERITEALQAVSKRVNQRLLLMELVDTKLASPYLIAPPVVPTAISATTTVSSNATTNSQSEKASPFLSSLPSIDTSSSTTSPRLPRKQVSFSETVVSNTPSTTRSLFRYGEFSCEEKFHYRFQLMPRITTLEALLMLGRTKALANFTVLNRPNTYSYFSAPNELRSYRTYYFTLKPCTASELQKSELNDKQSTPLLSSYADASFIELTVWGLEEVCHELSVDLVEVIYQNLYDYAILRLSQSLTRTQNLPLDYRDLLFITGAAPYVSPQSSSSSRKQHEIISNARSSSKLILCDEGNQSEEISDESSKLLKTQEYVTDATLHAGVQKSLSCLIELPPGIHDPFLFLLLLRQYISRTGTEQAAFLLPVQSPRQPSSSTFNEDSKVESNPPAVMLPLKRADSELGETRSPGAQRRSEGDFALGITRMPHVPRRRAQSMFTAPVPDSRLNTLEVATTHSSPPPIYSEVDDHFSSIEKTESEMIGDQEEDDEKEENENEEDFEGDSKIEVDFNPEANRFYYRHDMKGMFASDLQPGLALVHLHLLTKDKDGDIVPCARIETCQQKPTTTTFVQEWVDVAQSLSPQFNDWPLEDDEELEVKDGDNGEKMDTSDTMDGTIDSAAMLNEDAVEKEDIGQESSESNNSTLMKEPTRPVYMVGVVFQTSSRGEVKLEPLFEAFKVCFTEAMREALIEAYLRTPSIPLEPNNSKKDSQNADLQQIQVAKTVPETMDKKATDKVIKGEALVERIAKITNIKEQNERDDKDGVLQTQNSDEMSLSALLSLMSGPVMDDMEAPKRRAINEYRRQVQPVSSTSSSSSSSTSPSASLFSIASPNMSEMGKNKKKFAHHNRILSRANRSEVLPQWLLNSVLNDFLSSYSDTVNSPISTSISPNSSPKDVSIDWSDILVFRKVFTQEKQTSQFKRCLKKEELLNRYCDRMKYASSSIKSNDSLSSSRFNDSEFVVVLGRTDQGTEVDLSRNKIWNDHQFNVIDDAESGLSKMFTSFDESAKNTAKQATNEKKKIKGKLDRISSCLARRSVAVLEIGLQHQNLTFYNCEKAGGFGLVRKLVHCLDVAVAVAAARRNAFLRLCLPSLPAFRIDLDPEMESHRIPWIMSCASCNDDTLHSYDLFHKNHQRNTQSNHHHSHHHHHRHRHQSSTLQQKKHDDESIDEESAELLKKATMLDPATVSRRVELLLKNLKPSVASFPIPVITTSSYLKQLNERTLLHDVIYCDSLESSFGVNLDLSGNLELVVGVAAEEAHLMNNRLPSIQRSNSLRNEEDSSYGRSRSSSITLTESSSTSSSSSTKLPVVREIKNQVSTDLPSEVPSRSPPPEPREAEEKGHGTTVIAVAVEKTVPQNVVFSAPPMSKPPSGVTDPVQLAKIAAMNRRRNGVVRSVPTNKMVRQPPRELVAPQPLKQHISPSSPPGRLNSPPKGGGGDGGGRLRSGSVNKTVGSKAQTNERKGDVESPVDSLPSEETRELLSRNDYSHMVTPASASIKQSEPKKDTLAKTQELNSDVPLSLEPVPFPASSDPIPFPTLPSSSPSSSSSSSSISSFMSSMAATASSASMAFSGSSLSKSPSYRQRSATEVQISPRKRSESGTKVNTLEEFQLPSATLESSSTRLRHRSSTASDTSEGGDLFGQGHFPGLTASSSGLASTSSVSTSARTTPEPILAKENHSIKSSQDDSENKNTAKDFRRFEAAPMPWDRTIGFGAAATLRLRAQRNRISSLKKTNTCIIPSPEVGSDPLSQQAYQAASIFSVSMDMFTNIHKGQVVLEKWNTFLNQKRKREELLLKTNREKDTLRVNILISTLHVTTDELRKLMERSSREWNYIGDVNLKAISQSSTHSANQQFSLTSELSGSSASRDLKPDEVLFAAIDKHISRSLEGFKLQVRQASNPCSSHGKEHHHHHHHEHHHHDGISCDDKFCSSHLIHWYVVPLTEANLNKWGLSWNDMVETGETSVVPMTNEEGQNAMQVFLNKFRGEEEEGNIHVSSATSMVSGSDLNTELYSISVDATTKKDIEEDALIEDQDVKSLGFLLFSVSLCASSNTYYTNSSQITHSVKTRGWYLDNGEREGNSNAVAYGLLKLGHSLDPLMGTGLKALFTDLGLSSLEEAMECILMNKTKEVEHMSFCRKPLRSLGCSSPTSRDFEVFDLVWSVGKSYAFSPSIIPYSNQCHLNEWLISGINSSLISTSLNLLPVLCCQSTQNCILSNLGNQNEVDDEADDNICEKNAEKKRQRRIQKLAKFQLDKFVEFLKDKCDTLGRVIEMGNSSSVACWRWVGEVPNMILKCALSDEFDFEATNTKYFKCHFMIEFSDLDLFHKDIPLVIVYSSVKNDIVEEEKNQVVEIETQGLNYGQRKIDHLLPPGNRMHSIVGEHVSSLVTTVINDYGCMEVWEAFIHHHFLLSIERGVRSNENGPVESVGEQYPKSTIINEEEGEKEDEELDHLREDNVQPLDVMNSEKVIEEDKSGTSALTYKFNIRHRISPPLVSTPLRRLSYDMSLSCAYSDSEEGREQYGRTPDHVIGLEYEQQNSLPTLLSNPLFSPSSLSSVNRFTNDDASSSLPPPLSLYSSSSTAVPLPNAEDGLLTQLLEKCPMIPLSDLNENLDKFFCKEFDIFSNRRGGGGGEGSTTAVKDERDDRVKLRIPWGRVLEKIRSNYEAKTMNNANRMSALLFVNVPKHHSIQDEDHLGANFHMLLLPPPRSSSLVSTVVGENNNEISSQISEEGISFTQLQESRNGNHLKDTIEYIKLFEQTDDAPVLFSWNCTQDLLSHSPGLVKASVICSGTSHLASIFQAFPPSEASKTAVLKTMKDSNSIIEKKNGNNTVGNVIIELLDCFRERKDLSLQRDTPELLKKTESIELTDARTSPRDETSPGTEERDHILESTGCFPPNWTGPCSDAAGGGSCNLS